jgi:hypothetical protein
MDRRQFIKRAGVGSVGLGALAASPSALAGRPGFPKGDGHQHFTLVAISRTPTPVGGINHWMVLEGAGTFKPRARHADGGGNFVHLNGDAPLAGPIASGKWKVQDLVDYGSLVGRYGRVQASVLTVSVELRPDAGGQIPGTLIVTCNVGFANLLTGRPEGFELSAAGLNFNTPVAGLTHISIPEGESSA